jgi:hypothetical protein
MAVSLTIDERACGSKRYTGNGEQRYAGRTGEHELSVDDLKIPADCKIGRLVRQRVAQSSYPARVKECNAL